VPELLGAAHPAPRVMACGFYDGQQVTAGKQTEAGE
jgi:hypothetical protein